MGHLSFQRDFLFERLKTLTPAMQRLWRWQFQFIHLGTAFVVAWDHRDCLHSLGVSPADFRARAVRCWKTFQTRLERRLREFDAQYRHEAVSTPGYSRSSSEVMQSPTS